MRILDLALKDLSQVLRDKMSLLFLLVMPMVFTLVMGLAFSGAAQPANPRLPLGWVNADGESHLSQRLYADLEASGSVRWVEMDPADAETAVRRGQVAGALVIPAGFGQAAFSAAPLQLTLIADQSSTTGQSLFQIVRAAVVRTLSAVEITRLDLAALAAQNALIDEEAQAQEREAALKAALAGWMQTDQQGAWVRVECAVAQTEQAAPLGGNPFNQSSPGMLVQFAITGMIGAAGILVQERKTRTLQRLITTAMKPWQIIAGHWLAMVALVLGQTLLLILFGQLLLGVNYFREPLGVLLVATAFSLWIASMGLFIGMLAQGEEQVILFCLIAMFLFTSLGGAWFPLEVTSKAFYTIGHLTPGAWAMDGLQNILVRGLGLASVWQPAGILLAYALGFFVLAVWRFRAREA
ncbi:MAG: ABC transporter permease [Anaerolineae bacterium]|nr:ABC transporter permease [Anaerolineae bacterium]